MRYDLSTAAVGRELDKSPAAVARLILKGQLAAVRVGRTYRVSRADLDAFLERARVRPEDARGSDRLHQAIASHRHQAAERRCKEAGL
jgi:excisionase family DNA binding protein